MRRLLFLLPLLLLACSKDEDERDEPYPSIISEFALMKTDGTGRMVQFTTDENRTYSVSNTLSGYNKNAHYRVVCGYVPEGQSAHVYQLTGARLLRDSTQLGYKSDATKVTSVWRKGRFINMQLETLTQGQATQYWGYCIDSVSGRTTHLSLHHRQNGDPLSYTQTVYASLPMDSLRSIPTDDSIALHITTFKGDRVWRFKR